MNTPIKPNRPEEVSKGLGDSIEKFTKLTGIKKLV